TAPTTYGRTCFSHDPNKKPDMGGIVDPQWAIGFEKPFRDKVGIEYKDGVVVKVHGNSLDAEIVRDMLVGVNATLHELGCGFNPKYPRFKAYPDRKSTRLNSSHQIISYAVFCL